MEKETISIIICKRIYKSEKAILHGERRKEKQKRTEERFWALYIKQRPWVIS